MRPPLYYKRSLFLVFYYQVRAVIHRIFPGRAVASMGYSAALCGVIYFIAPAVYLNRLAGIGPWWSLFIFLNTPALVVNFLYGNEASLAMALLSVAAALIVVRRGIRFRSGGSPEAANNSYGNVILAFEFAFGLSVCSLAA